MDKDFLTAVIDFFKETELLKLQTRTAWLSNGKRESVAEHTWRMSLMVMCLSAYENDIDISKIMKMSIIHDLGEACEGDISATVIEDRADKLKREAICLNQLTEKLPGQLKEEILALWEEYNAGVTAEAKLVRGIDKLETIIQHNQGCNPEDFDYEFNMEYGRDCTDQNDMVLALREIIDLDTRDNCK